MDLDNLKYNELQKLAKKCGIKANMKVEKLVNALKDHYSKQGQDDSESDSKKAEEKTSSSTHPDAAKEKSGAGDGAEDEPAAKKAPARGRKKGQKRVAKGKAKKTSSSDETPDDDDDVVTLKKVSPQPKAVLSSSDNKPQRSASAGRKTAASITPTIVKPVSSKSLGNRTPGAQSTGGRAKTPSKDQKTKVKAGPGTPGFLSPRGPGPASRPSGAVSRMTPKTTSGNGKNPQLASSSASKENKKSPASGGKKRPSPRNDKQQQDEQAKNKAAPEKAAYKRKRHDTFELEEPSLASTLTPEAERTTKRARLSSGDGKGSKPATPNGSGVKGEKPATPKGSGVKGEKPATPKEDKSATPKGSGVKGEKPSTPKSPGVQDMLDSMTGNMSSAERRTRLMDALNKKVETKVKSSPQTGPVTQIPRFAAFLAKKREEQKKPITPGNKDWAKVHKKEFSKFDSIDVYLEKKRKRAEEMTASVKKARTVLQEVQQAVTKLKSKRTPSLGTKSGGKKSASQPFKPTVTSTKDMNLNFGASTSTSSSRTSGHSKSSAASSKPFKPTVTSTKNMKLNFSAIKTPVNQKAAEDKTTPIPSAARSAARKSSGVSARKSLGASARKSLANTPFQFTGNLTMSEVKSTSKPAFDLKASLARPITWKPHTGKLKPLSQYSTGQAKGLDKSACKPAAPSRMDVFKTMINKTQKTYSRHDRRVAAAVKRADQKHEMQMKRRGIVVSP